MSYKPNKTELNWEETQRQIATMIGNYDESDECLTMKKKFIALVKSTNRPGIDKLLEDLEKKKEWGLNFWNQPASTKFHGSEVGGLLRHSLNVWNQLCILKENSGDKCNIPNDSLILVSLFHDLCKWNSYTFNITPKTKEISSQTYKWDNHLPLGHGDMSVIILQKYLTLSNEEAMMIRWHMGPFDKTYFENQSNIETYCPQARYVFLADYWASGLEGTGGDE